uniref:Uncharacterized protein n=1 Tax=Dicentrarchus labrax TaxID=13489 RepID=A0A8C4HZT7_DICLA
MFYTLFTVITESTLCHWTLIQNRNGDTLCPPPPGSELSNRFTVLEELCIFISSPPELSPNRLPGMLLRNWLTREDPVLPRPCSRCSPNENSREHVPASQLPSASTLIVTDSIVSDVKKRLAKTVWFPGAKGRFLTDKLMTILNSDPHAEAVVIHVGRNNIPLQQSELLKQVNHSSTCVLISDPLPAIKRGMGRLHRLLSLNTLIQSKNLVDNLNLFWTHQDFLKMDGIHPIFLGSLIACPLNIIPSCLLRGAGHCWV